MFKPQRDIKKEHHEELEKLFSKNEMVIKEMYRQGNLTERQEDFFRKHDVNLWGETGERVNLREVLKGFEKEYQEQYRNGLLEPDMVEHLESQGIDVKGSKNGSYNKAK